MKPQNYRDGLEGPWELFGEEYQQNPKYLVENWAFDMLDIWSACQGGKFSVGHLPESGGVMDQSAIMLDAFNVIRRTLTELEKGK